MALKGNWTKDTRWAENIENLQITCTLHLAVTITLYPYIYTKKKHFYFGVDSELLLVQSCWFALHKGRGGKGWLLHMLASFMMSLTQTQTARHKMAALRAHFLLYYQAKVFTNFKHWFLTNRMRNREKMTVCKTYLFHFYWHDLWCLFSLVPL